MKNLKNTIFEYLILIFGSMLVAFTTYVFMIPCKIGSGGVTGIALCFNALFGWQIGLFSILMNAPLFLFGYKILGKKFTIRSVFSVIVTSVLIDNMHLFIKIPTLQDKLLASIFCGVLLGIAIALIFVASGSTGGLDISAKIINNKFKNTQISNLLLIQDIIVYIFVGIVMGPSSVMYAIILSFIRSKTMDAIQEGLASSRQCVIICENSTLMIDEIKSELIRGVTVLDAVGGYSSSSKKFIYLVIQKNQLNTLKTIVAKVEPEAFVTISPVNNIIGNYKNRAFTVQ